MAQHRKLAAALATKSYVLTHRYEPAVARLYESQGASIVCADAIMSISRRGASRREMIVIGPKRRRCR